MFVGFGFVLLALSSLTAASDPDCEELVKPLEDQKGVTGKWILHAGTSDNEEALKHLKLISSSWIELSHQPDSDDMLLRWGDKMNGKCHYGSTNTTLSGNTTKVTFHFNSSTHEHVGKYLVTCPECIIWSDTSVTVNGESKNTRNLYLLAKSETLDASFLETFKKQAACLNFPPDFYFVESTDLCPDETEAAADAEADAQ